MSKLLRGIRNPSKIPPYLLTKIKRSRIQARMWYYRLTSDSFTEAYRRLMNYRISSQGARSAVGSDGLGIGRLQYEFLLEQGLSTDDTLLDIGCGSLRGGQFFISYLDPENYTGMDISPKAIESGKEMLDDDLIERKQPNFVVNEDLKFHEVNGSYDFAIAQSVFTHLPESEIRECLNHLHEVISPEGEFYATFFTDPSYDNAKNFVYSTTKIEDIALDTGWSAYIYSAKNFPHPRNQIMVKFTREGS